jgi:uncharacterized protein (DUF302 family)
VFLSEKNIFYKKEGNMKNFIILVSGIVLGVILTGAIVFAKMPSMMLTERVSPLEINETVEKIKENALKEGWVIAGVSKMHESVKKHGGFDISEVYLINLCQAEHAYKILSQDDSKIVSVMMPCTISVYKKNDGKTYIGSMNAGLLGKAFGGVVAEVMGNTVAAQQQKFLEFAPN